MSALEPRISAARPDGNGALGLGTFAQQGVSAATNHINASQPNQTEINYWPEFGTLQYFELTYIICIIVTGAFGNLIVICSIILEKKVHTSGNVFIINLAIADFMVCSLTLPSIAANIVTCGNALNKLFCDIVGFIITATAASSLCNLALVALNRYWAVVKSASYRKFFSKKIGIGLALFAWVWSALIISPTLFGWGSLTFDAKSLVCAWLDTASLSYSVFLITVSVLLPLGVIAFSYYKIFSTVRASGRWRRNLASSCQPGSDRFRRLLQRERSLIYTLLATVIAFFVCWTPYAVHVFVEPGHTAPQVKKFLVWLALSNSTLNWIIYGTLNPAFKKGYRKLFFFVLRCFEDERASGSRSAWSSGHTADRSVNAMKVNSVSKRQSRRYSSYPEILHTQERNTDALIANGTAKEPQEKRRIPLRVRLKRMFSSRSNTQT